MALFCYIFVSNLIFVNSVKNSFNHLGNFFNCFNNFLSKKNKSSFCKIAICCMIFSGFLYAPQIAKSENAKNDIIYVLTSPDYPPFESIKNDKIVGIDADILEALKKETGLNLQFQSMQFGQIIGALTSGNFHIGLAGFSVTEERKNSVNFSSIYYKGKPVILSKKENSFKHLSQLQGKTIGGQNGTTQIDVVKFYNNTTNNKINIVVTNNNNTAIQMLLVNRLDAAVFDGFPGMVFAKQYGLYLSEIDNDGIGEGTAIAFSKNFKHQAQINNALQKLIANGTINKIINKWQESYVKDALQESRHDEYKTALLSITKGIGLTLQYTFCSIFFSLILALILSIMTHSKIKPFMWFAKVYVSIIRGTPMLLQLSCVYFGLPKLLDVNISVFVSGVVTFSLNSSAYVAEIIRSGVRSIDKGQLEACKSLNLSKMQTIKDIYIPQVFHNIFPSLMNEFITLLKDSSLISVFGGYEIMQRTNVVIADYYVYFVPLFVAGVCYYIMTFILECISHWWEKRYKY